MKNLFLKINARCFIGSLLFGAISVMPVFSQEKPGKLSGRITDEQGNFVAFAEVLLINAVGKRVKTLSADTGLYIFADVLPGKYDLEIKSKDFDIFKAENISVEPGKTSYIDAQLKIKPIIETVNVEPASESNSNPNNLGDIKLNEKQIEEELPDDPDALTSALKALAPTGPGEPQIFVDGFETSKPPPKQTIREIRISSNSFTAEDDRPSGARIQIFTKSGRDKLQGSVFFNWSDDKLNARNPFSKFRPPYSYRQYGLNLGGKLVPNKASFFISFQKLDEDQSGIITARTLDSSLNIISLNSPFIVPRRDIAASARVDWQLNEANSLTVRYGFNRNNIDNIGIGELTLAERGSDLQIASHVFQLSETSALNSQTANEFRFQFVGTETRRIDSNPSVSLNVQDAFLGGGAGFGQSTNQDNRFELQDYVTTNFTKHLLRFGARLRFSQIDDVAPNNFNGSFTFTGGEAPLLDENNEIIRDSSGQPILTTLTSLERYRRTLILRNAGFSGEEIRRRGGGATQFSIARGDAQAKVSQFDLGLFFQDEWRLKPNLNIYLGLRYEGQTNIGDLSNLAPRMAFAWVPRIGKSEKTTIRGGIGIYYGRFDTSYLLQAGRFDGIRQQRFLTSDPILVDSFPNIPSPELLSDSANRQSVTRLTDNLQASRTVVGLVGLEHKFSPTSTLSSGFSYYRTRHSVRQRNINAPLPGTYIFGQPESGVRPFGDIGSIFLVESSNDFFQNQLYINYRNQVSTNINIAVQYVLSDTWDGGVPGSFPANSYDVRSDWGRSSAFSIRHRVYLNGRIEIPKTKVIFAPQLTVFSQRPFNITTGLDTNGDQIFSERPAFAETNNGINVYNTPFGIFDINPSPGQQIIPRNIGKGPSFFSFNTIISRVFAFGKVADPKAKSIDKAYKLLLSVQIQNLFNNVNLSTPIGNLSSPLFGQSVSTAGLYGFDNGSSAYNRRIEAQIRFSF